MSKDRRQAVEDRKDKVLAIAMIVMILIIGITIVLVSMVQK